MSESWDSDPDLEFPTGSLSLHLASISGSDAEGEGATSTSPASVDSDALFSSHEEEEPTSWDDTPASSEREREREEENQGSIESKNGTIKGLMTSFSGMSLDSTLSTSSSETEMGSITPAAVEESPSLLRTKTSTLRLTSSLSVLLSTVGSGPGKVTHLGSTPQGKAKSVLGDWDEDLDLPTEFLRPLRAKGSFASHISDDPDDDDLLHSIPTPRSSLRRGKAEKEKKREASAWC